jgi:hypothetical protein
MLLRASPQRVRAGRTSPSVEANLIRPNRPTHNAFMIIRGRVQNGVIVFLDGATLPEGTKVLIELVAPPEVPSDRMTEPQRRALRETRQHFESLANENPGDTFTGGDHDRVLYGDG